MRLCIYQKFPLYPVKRQFPILSQNNYSMIVGSLHSSCKLVTIGSTTCSPRVIKGPDNLFQVLMD